MSVQVLPLNRELEHRIPDYPKLVAATRQGTPFSMQRFCIPRLSDFRGRSVYLDSDMQVFGDIRELFTWAMGASSYCAAKSATGSKRPPQLSVMLIDCERTCWRIEEIASSLRANEYKYDELMGGTALGNLGRILPAEWNSLEQYEKGKTRLLHFTDMDTQPWLSASSRYAELWCGGLLDAIEGEFITRELVADHVKRGWVRPSLLAQVDQKIADPLLLSRKILAQDFRVFVPPHQYQGSAVLKYAARLGETDPGTVGFIFRRLYAAVLWNLKKLPFMGLIKRFLTAATKARRALATGFRPGI